jgi:hypothetical protein
LKPSGCRPFDPSVVVPPSSKQKPRRTSFHDAAAVRTAATQSLEVAQPIGGEGLMRNDSPIGAADGHRSGVPAAVVSGGTHDKGHVASGAARRPASPSAS